MRAGEPGRLPLLPDYAAPLAAAPAAQKERKIVTVLFADLVGFTARSERLDPEDVRALLGPTTRA